jgi:endonuclease YncB( thermonuclease family)
MAIRLQGLGAPEGHEPGGGEAAEAMRSLVLRRELRCELDGTRTRDRCVGVCYLEGEDIAEVMVRHSRRRGDRANVSAAGVLPASVESPELDQSSAGQTVRPEHYSTTC